MMDWVTKNLSDLSSDKPRPESLTIEREQKSPEVLIVDKDTDQAHVVMAWRTFRRDHPDRHIARLVKNILKGGMSSRLFIRLRDEMGSGYYVSANHALHTSFGYFGVATGTTHVRVAEIVKAVIEEAEKLKTEPITKEELDKVKEFMRAHRLMSLETSDDVAGYLAEQEAFDGEIISPEEFEAIFGEMTADDVMRVAKILFDRTKLTIAAIGRGIDREAVIKAVS
jgi:predicted Zn-dependent peptidase